MARDAQYLGPSFLLAWLSLALMPSGQVFGPQQALELAVGDGSPNVLQTTQADSGTQLTLDELIRMALDVNPKVSAARARISAAQNRVVQARSLPDPEADVEFWPIESHAQQLASGRNQSSLMLRQTIPWPEKLRTDAEVNCREVQMAQAELREVENEIVESVRLAYYELWYAQRASQIIEENRKLAQEIIKAAEARYRAGGSQQDVIRAELELEKRHQEIVDLTKEIESARAELATLVQQPIDLAVVAAEELPVSNLPGQLESLLAEAEHCNPQLQGLAAQVQRDLEKQRLAGLQRFPDLTFGFGYSWMTQDGALDPVADGVDDISFSVGTTLPIWKRKIAAGVGEASAERSNSIQLHEAEWSSIAGRLRRLVNEATALDRQSTLYKETILPRAGQALQIAQAEYVVGKTSFIQLIDNNAEVLNFQMQQARVMASLASVLAQIERAIGCGR